MITEIIALILILAGVIMFFTSNLGYGDAETAKYLISTALVLLGAYYYGYYRGWKAIEGKIKQKIKKR